MASTKCAKCLRKLTPFNRDPRSPDTHQNCDLEAKASVDDVEISQVVEPSVGLKSSLNVSPPDVPISSAKYQSQEVKIAIQSARIVNTYGSLIQVVGVIFGIINAVGGFYLTSYSGNPAWVVCGVLFGLIVIFLCAVQGALFRMISNYVIARLKD
jgi:hypothetical protein